MTNTAPKILYFDESGFTGSNLLDPAQPYFSIASTDFEPELAKQILQASFPKYQGPEYKFVRVWQSQRSRNGLVTFCNKVAEHGYRTHTWTVQKEYGVLTKIMDYLVEPMTTAAGYDFYDEGFCWRYANILHYELKLHVSPEFLRSILADYLEFSRDPTLRSLERLQFQLALKANSTPEDVQGYVQHLAKGAEVFLRFNNLKTFRDTNDLQMTVMIAAVVDWRKQCDDDLAVIHDASSNFLRQRKMWDKITNSDVPKQLHRLGDGTYVQYPLRVVSTEQADSRDHTSIQLCDIVAGLMAKFHAEQIEDEAILAAAKKLASNICINGMIAAPFFPVRMPPKRLSGPDIIDEMNQIILGSHNDSRPQG